VLAWNPRCNTPWSKEIGVEEHSAGQLRNPQDVGQSIHAGFLAGSGVSVMSVGGPIIDPQTPENIKSIASAKCIAFVGT
jgi:hypothetical protein